MKDSTAQAVLPSQLCREAEEASQRALDTISEIFGESTDPEPAHDFEDEPTIIRRWRNGGREKLRKALRDRGFATLPVAAEGVKSA